MPACYILWSEEVQKFYVGSTQHLLADRIKKHNDGFYNGQKFTKIASDWVLFLSINVGDYSHAIRLERKIKAMKSSVYIRNMKRYPEMIDKLRLETKV